MGALDHPIGELFERVNDSRYHVIRFQRNGQNATIQVDQHAVQMKNPKGIVKLTWFKLWLSVYVLKLNHDAIVIRLKMLSQQPSSLFHTEKVI